MSGRTNKSAIVVLCSGLCGARVCRPESGMSGARYVLFVTIAHTNVYCAHSSHTELQLLCPRLDGALLTRANLYTTGLHAKPQITPMKPSTCLGQAVSVPDSIHLREILAKTVLKNFPNNFWWEMAGGDGSCFHVSQSIKQRPLGMVMKNTRDREISSSYEPS